MPSDPPAVARRRLGRIAVDVRPLAIPAYRRTLLGQATSSIGTMVSEVAVPVQIYAIPHSSLYVGLVVVAALSVRSFWTYYARPVTDSHEATAVAPPA